MICAAGENLLFSWLFITSMCISWFFFLLSADLNLTPFNPVCEPPPLQYILLDVSSHILGIFFFFCKCKWKQSQLTDPALSPLHALSFKSPEHTLGYSSLPPAPSLPAPLYTPKHNFPFFSQLSPVTVQPFLLSCLFFFLS